MRNLYEYPITKAEKIAVLRELHREIVDQNIRDEEAGDIRPAVLSSILTDLYHATAIEEGLNERGG